MALGTAVVGSNLGGLSALLKKSGGGIAVEPDDLNAYIRAVKKYLAQPNLAYSHGELGRRYVSEYLNLENNVRELIATYELILEEKKYANHI